MRQAVTFHCTVCGKQLTPPATTYYLKVTAAAVAVTIVKRFCSLQCLITWCGG